MYKELWQETHRIMYISWYVKILIAYNDLHSFLQSSQVDLQMVHILADDVEENIEMFLKLYLLLYADDAVLL